MSQVPKDRSFKTPEHRRVASRERMRKRREQEPEEVKKYQKEWRDAHRDAVRQQARESAARRDPAKKKASQRAWAEKNRERLSLYAKAKYQAARHVWRDNQLRRQFGITLETYLEMLNSQGGCCAICSRPPNGKSLAVDHCHKTGLIRGLLCNGCNVGIGHLQDDPEVLARALAYLKRHS